MSVFVRHEACPRCGSRDNLARYSDGGAWCFGCHYRERANRIPVIDEKYLEKEVKSVQLADDLCNDYPGHVVEWLARYDVSVAEALSHGWKYSPKFDQLVFIFQDAEGNVGCTQARNFRSDAKTKDGKALPKYFNQGSAADVLPVFRWRASTAGKSLEVSSRKLVVVEDAVSAARIARQSDAMPCLGSYLPVRKLTALKLLNYEHISVWLDSDKLKEAMEIATKAKWLGLSSKVIYTDLDPKEYKDDEIKKYLS
jgi:hypothetical protein